MPAVADLKARWADIPGIQNLTVQHIAGRDTYGFDGKIVAIDPRSTLDEIDTAVRAAASSPAIAQMPAGQPIEDPASAGIVGADLSPATLANREADSASPVPSASLLPPVTVSNPKVQAMTNPTPGSFAASLKAMMDDARAGVEQARTEGKAKVADAVKKLGDAKTATAHVAGNMASAIEEEAASVMSELAQISNDLGV